MSALITAHAGTTHYVATNGPGPSPYINWAQAASTLPLALTASVDGDTIVISNGVYWPAATMAIGKSVTITSLNGSAQTIFNGGGQAISFLSMDNAAVTATVHGLTITNFFAAGIYMANGTLTLAACNITGNQLNGGRYCGGGIHSQGWGTHNIFMYITNCTIRGNTAIPLATPVQYQETGAGIFYWGKAGTTCQVDNCVISDNNAGAGYAGGAWVYDPGVLVIQNCTIANNTGTGVKSAARVSNSIISGNNGGGLNSIALVENCLVYNNYGPVWGAGIGSSLIVRNCTVISNYSSQWRPGIYDGIVVNCIAYSNFNQTGAAANYDLCDSVTYSASTVTMPAGAGNIATNNLMLVNTPFDCHLLKGSPCINKGTNEAWMNGSVDLGGHGRIVDRTVDMGAYEWFPKGTIFYAK